MDAKEKPRQKGISIRLSAENIYKIRQYKKRSKVLSEAILASDLSMFQELETLSEPQAFVLSEEAIKKLRRLPKKTRSKAVNYVISQMAKEDGRETSN